MWDNGHYILWQHITEVFFQDDDNDLKLLPRLIYEHVNRAAQVLSASVASVLRAFGPPDAAGTARLCEMVDQFFDCLNVRSLTEHQRKQKSFLAPYRSVQDGRYV